MAIKSYSVRIDAELLDKFHIAADYEGRSANSQICVLIRNFVERHEKAHGKIEIGNKKS